LAVDFGVETPGMSDSYKTNKLDRLLIGESKRRVIQKENEN
jgi:hypothetical protein